MKISVQSVSYTALCFQLFFQIAYSQSHQSAWACSANATEVYPVAYTEQYAECRAFISSNIVSDYKSRGSQYQVPAERVVKFLQQIQAIFTGKKVDWNALILTGAIFLAPVIALAIFVYMVIAFIPFCIARCCCARCCCKPKHKFGEFPKGTCKGWCCPVVLWIIFFSIIIASIVMFYIGFDFFWKGCTLLFCEVLYTIHQLYSWSNSIIVGISNRIESIDVSGTIITPLNAILTRLDGQEQQYEQISKNIQDVAKSTCLKIKNNFSELLHDNYLNCQEQGYVDTDFSASMGAENIKAMQKRLTDTASASFDAGKHMSVLKDAIVAVFDPLTVSIFGYSYSLSSTSHPNSTSSLLPAVPKIPVLLPDGIQSGASINKWLLSFFPKTFLLAFLLFFPMLFASIFVFGGTVAIMCGSKESCSHEKQAKENIDEVEYDQPQKNASAINKHILGGRCASRFGCGCLWATTTIFVVIVALLLFFSQALNFTCGVLTLPPSQIMSTTADFFGDPDAANSTNQVNAMQQASEALLKGDSMSISKLAELFGASDAALNTSGASDVVDKLADSVNVDNIQVNLRNVSGALNRSRADNEKRMHSDKDMALGKAACDTCNKAKDASDMYNRTGFTKVYEALTSQNCAVNCISSGSYCQVTFCQAYNLLDATNTMYNNISTGFSKMLIVLNNVDTEFEGLKNMIQEKKGSLNLEIASLDSCLNDIDISVFKKSFDGIMNPLCYHFSVGFGLLSWCCFAFCCSSVILVSVQVCIHVRMAGIGQQKSDLYSYTPNNDDKDEDAQAYEDYKKKDPSTSHTEIELANRASLRQSDIEV